MPAGNINSESIQSTDPRAIFLFPSAPLSQISASFSFHCLFCPYLVIRATVEYILVYIVWWRSYFLLWQKNTSEEIFFLKF